MVFSPCLKRCSCLWLILWITKNYVFSTYRKTEMEWYNLKSLQVSPPLKCIFLKLIPKVIWNYVVLRHIWYYHPETVYILTSHVKKDLNLCSVSPKGSFPFLHFLICQISLSWLMCPSFSICKIIFPCFFFFCI